MTGPQTPLFGLKFRLTLMMGVLLFASLALIYVLNLQGERELLAAVHDTLESVEVEVNKAWKEYAAQREAEEVASVDRMQSDIWVSPQQHGGHFHLYPSDRLLGLTRDEGWREQWEMAQSRIRDAYRALHRRVSEDTLVEIKVISEEPAPTAPQKRANRAQIVSLPRQRAPADRRILTWSGAREEAAEGARSGISVSPAVARRPGPLAELAGRTGPRAGVAGSGSFESAASEVSEIPDWRRDILVYLSPLELLVEDLRLRSILIVLGVFLLGMVLSWALASRFTAPIEKMKLAFGRVAAGDLREPDLSPRGDEIGQMGTSFQRMTQRLRENRELEKRVAEQERFTTLGHLAAGVAHDIRNPLNAIGLTIDHMQDEFCPPDADRGEAYRHYSQAIKGEIARLNHLVNNFLTLAKPPSLELRPTDLNALVMGMLDLVRKEAESRGVVIETELASDLPPVTLDPERARAAVMNLVLNALQAIEGSGKITIQTRTVGREAHLRIDDDGRGIAAEDLEKVFLPYWTTREEGTGLGLAVSRATIEGHGGRIEIASQADQGTTVRVALPLEGPERR